MFTKRWNAPYGYKAALKVGLPLVVSMLSSTVMTFTDRIFLGNYSLDALAASLPAAMAAFFFLSFFFGTAEYVGVFVSQYTGACRHERVGAALWQGLWFCLPSGLVLASLALLADPLFALAGHPEDIRSLEVAYFRILTLGGGPFLVGICLSCFFSGRGLTKPVMLVNMAATAINIPLDYCLINGVGPFPELGIVGAGLATLVGYTLPAVVFGTMVFTRANEHRFRVRSAWRLDRELFGRFLRYGLPGGVQFFLEMFAIVFFVFMVGRIGEVELAATNIAFSVDTLAFLPMIGMSIAASIMVGQAMGAGEPERAVYATLSILHLALAYMLVMAVIFLTLPELLVAMFRSPAESAADFAAVNEIGVMLLRYVAAFTLIDAVTIVYMGALKGAGDSRFIMKTMGAASLFLMVLPVLAVSAVTTLSVHVPWICLLVYILFVAAMFMRRFHRGPWRDIRMIDRG